MEDGPMGDNAALIERFRQAATTGDFTQLGALLMEVTSDDFVEYWPQSGERITKQNFMRLGEAYEGATGTSPTFKLGEIRDGGDHIVVEGFIDYGNGTTAHYVGISELAGGKVSKVTEYFAAPFEAPEWRKPYVE
jgi:hypothetical protein